MYEEAVGAFYTGVAAVQVGESGVAEAMFRRVTELAPREPAAWADLGLVALQRRELELAADRLERARSLAPDNGRIQLLSALVARESGRLDAATGHLRRALELEPRNLKALYLLAQIAEQEDRPGSAAEARQLVDRILAVQPVNLVALLERARLAAKGQDIQPLRETLDRIDASAEATASAGAQLRAVRAAGEAGKFDVAATEIAFVQTELQSLPVYRRDQDALLISPDGVELLLQRFLLLPAPSARPAPPDTGLAFVAESLSVGERRWAWVRRVWLSEEVPLALVAADQRTVWISPSREEADTFAFPGGDDTAPLPPSAVATLDYNYDFRVDLALAGRGGLRLLRQDDAGDFSDATLEAIPPAVARGAYTGAWAADLDMEGDLDLVVARVEGAPVVLRNRGDGRFEPGPDFAGVTALREFAWADLDADGDPDAALLDAEGRLHVFLNLRDRVPQFEPHPLPDALRAQAIAVADLNQDATLDLVLLQADGTLTLVWAADDAWQTRAVGRWPDFAAAGVASTSLFLADLDNNGAVDAVASTPTGTRVWLGTPEGLKLHRSLADRISDVADLSGEGRLDLIGLAPDGTWRLLANRGSRDYYSTILRPQAASATGDRRINPFGIGGEIEVRAGLLYQKQPIQAPTVHFGLGEHERANVARIVWPNGSVQAEFNLSATNEAMVARQRLKGSCPSVFTFDGRTMRFVTDFLWRTALGLRINAQGAAAVIHSEDWIKIRGDQMAAREGFYDVRITGELWETHFFDHVALLVVDHPEGTEVLVDERFALPAPVPVLHAMSPPRPVERAWDQNGRDVTARVRALDEHYLDTFERGPYQGIAEDHFVEIALGDDVPAGGPVWLVASGWVYPTDASINVAISQGGHPPPHGLQLEVPDGRGGWTVVRSDLGFPAGKTKTILIDLENVFRPDTPRRLRLRTNMEVYWDRIAWALGQPQTPLRTRRLLPATAELRYRGFSEVHQAGRTAPELPDYHRIAGTAPQWRDLIGYYTRYGDVRPLNESVDDRYIIMNAGDELVLRFPAHPDPPAGWTRDFVLIGDGWVKDGDYNTGFSKTVLPLPYHGLSDYSRPPGRLQDDPAYRRHPEDWQIFHTRYVTPQDFHHALVQGRRD
ncbi:MAG: VCBS repeat-containing protein [Gemmatimonadetes bacterium]|nr:VCBS repeat-containing protein [Gemmatimonadota bacterium]